MPVALGLLCVIVHSAFPVLPSASGGPMCVQFYEMSLTPTLGWDATLIVTKHSMGSKD